MEKHNNFISVIIPAFNAEKYIKTSIKSVLRQTFQEFEIIAIDDSSSDNTFMLMTELSKIDKRIVLVQNRQNIGVSLTRNRGISMAKGNWIAFLDSDDEWEETKLEKQLKKAEETGGDFIFTGSRFIDSSGRYYHQKLNVPEKIDFKHLLKQNIISCSSVLIKKNVIEKYPMKGDYLHEDYAVWLQVLKKTLYAYGVNEPLLIYRISKSSKSGNKIKSAIMTYRVYLYVGLNRITAFYYWIHYICRSIKKYQKLK